MTSPSETPFSAAPPSGSTADGKPLGQYPVVALQDAEVAGFFGRLWDAIVMFFKSL